MQKFIRWPVLALALVTLTACTPFFYGGIVVLGDPKDEPAEATDLKG